MGVKADVQDHDALKYEVFGFVCELVGGEGEGCCEWWDYGEGHVVGDAAAEGDVAGAEGGTVDSVAHFAGEIEEAERGVGMSW